MWIVALALRRPYTFIVMALLIIIMAGVAISRTAVDIFPDINIPVVAIVWQYAGLSPQEMTDRIVSNTERGLTTMVNDIEHIDSQAMTGRAVEKIFFQQGTSVQTSIAQVTAAAQMMTRNLPQGTQPPVILIYSASSVPIIQLGFSSHALPEQDLNDIAQQFVRAQLSTI